MLNVSKRRPGCEMTQPSGEVPHNRQVLGGACSALRRFRHRTVCQSRDCRAANMIAVSIMVALFLDCRRLGHHVKIDLYRGQYPKACGTPNMFNFHFTKELHVYKLFDKWEDVSRIRAGFLAVISSRGMQQCLKISHARSEWDGCATRRP